MNCFFCGDPVDPSSRAVWRRVAGWEHKSYKGGTRRGGSDISMREPTGELACDRCINLVKRGIDPKQERLI